MHVGVLLRECNFGEGVDLVVREGEWVEDRVETRLGEAEFEKCCLVKVEEAVVEALKLPPPMSPIGGLALLVLWKLVERRDVAEGEGVEVPVELALPSRMVMVTLEVEEALLEAVP